jgi:hypothetical protein
VRRARRSSPARQEPRELDEIIGDAGRRARLGAIELVAVVVVILAIIALLVWFFLFAHNPLLRS